ncbi:MAG: VOC family protein [Lachnospiraceae bacterium]|nr:VOC family protein [Lachnospiraceae bacterium]
MQKYCFGLNHIGIFTEDLKASEDFYKDIFGFEEVFHVDAGEGGEFDITVIKKDDCQIELLQLKKENRNVQVEALNTLNHFALNCSDTKAFVQVLKEKGIHFETEEDEYVKAFGTPPRDLDIIFLHGPAGERIEIYQEIWNNMEG